MKSLFNMEVGLVGKVLDMQLQRQNVIAGNLANVETPNYKPRELNFEEELQAALGLDARGRLSLTEPGHIPSTFDPEHFGPEWEKRLRPHLVYGEDHVDIDKEMAKHAKNQLQYSALTQVMAKTFEGINSVITDGKQA